MKKTYLFLLVALCIACSEDDNNEITKSMTLKGVQTGQLQAHIEKNGNVREIETLVIEGVIDSVDCQYLATLSALKKLDLSQVQMERTPVRMLEKHSSLEEVLLPAGLKVIGAEAFYRCSKLRTCVIPEGVKTIEDGTFAACGLETMKLPATIQRIGVGFACGCPDLKELILPENYNDTLFNVGASCPNLKSMTILQATKYCAWYSFVMDPDTMEEDSDCLIHFQSLKLLSAVPTPARIALDEQHKKSIRLEVPQGAETDYQSHTVWGEFENITAYSL